MEAALVMLALAFTANKIVSTIKNLTTAGTRVAALTQLLVWAVAIAVVLVASQADLTETHTPPGLTQPLGDLDFWSLALLGLMAGSTGSVAYDFKKAFDSSDSAAEPALLHPAQDAG